MSLRRARFTHRVSVPLTPDFVALLDSAAAHEGKTRAEVLRDAASAWLADFHALDGDAELFIAAHARAGSGAEPLASVLSSLRAAGLVTSSDLRRIEAAAQPGGAAT